MKSTVCFDDDVEMPDGPENMAFVGVGRGDYMQEMNYKFVGDGNGEFEMVSAPPRPRSNVCWFLCMSSAISLVVAVLFWGVVVDHPEGIQTTPSPLPVEATVTAALSCDLQELRTGDQVEARYAISFRPAGHLAPGALGQVVAVLPSDAGGGHSAVINWLGHAQLQGSKVSQSQIMKVIKPGDVVESLVRIEPPAPSGPAGWGDAGNPTELQVDDLLLAAANIDDRVPTGTYGYVVQVHSAGEYRYTVDFPEFPQFANTKVFTPDVVKAPLVADRVEAIEAIEYGDGNVVAAGTLGTVATMTRESTTYTYVVTWDGMPSLPRTPVGGLRLKVALASERPAIPAIPQGSQGRVVATTRNAEGGVVSVMVAWDGYPQAGAANVSRVRLAKAPDWSATRRQRCCDERGIGCVPLARDGLAELYNCMIPGNWSEQKVKWCCTIKGVRCPASTAVATDNAKRGGEIIPAMRPIFNCSTHEQWPEVKRQYCCGHQGIGCAAPGAHGSAGGATPSGWSTLVSDACKESQKSTSVSLAMDKARADLMGKDPGHCMMALVGGAALDGPACAGSVTPTFVVEGSNSITVYSAKVGGSGSQVSASAGVQPGSCWMMTHNGCAVNSTANAGCTHFLFTEGAAPALLG